jgi:hypothetical protein
MLLVFPKTRRSNRHAPPCERMGRRFFTMRRLLLGDLLDPNIKIVNDFEEDVIYCRHRDVRIAVKTREHPPSLPGQRVAGRNFCKVLSTSC